jgi:hypothetical protein
VEVLQRTASLLPVIAITFSKMLFLRAPSNLRWSQFAAAHHIRLTMGSLHPRLWQMFGPSAEETVQRFANDDRGNPRQFAIANDNAFTLLAAQCF